jgi:hypothetical protein
MSGSLWEVLKNHLAIIALLQLQRQAYWWGFVRPMAPVGGPQTVPTTLYLRTKWYLANFYSVYGYEVSLSFLQLIVRN